MRKRIQLQAEQKQNKLSTFGQKGENLLDLPEFVGEDYAISVKNLLILAQGRLAKTGGTETVVGDGTTAIKKGIKIGDKYYYQSGTDLKVDNGGVQTTIKTFATDNKCAFAKFGNYLFVCNGDERIGYVTLSTNAWTLVSDASAPKSDILFIFGTRIYGNDVDNPSKVISAEQYVSGVPFQNWTVASTPALTTDPFSIDFGNAGEVHDISALNGSPCALYSEGDTSFAVGSIDIDTVGVRLNVTVQSEKLGIGGFRALSTSKGLFVLNRAGVFMISNFGATNQSFTRQEQKISRLFSKTFTEQIDFSNGDMLIDEVNNLLIITCADRATFNNLVLVYNIELGAFSRITEWTLGDLFVLDNVFYGTDSTTGKIYQLFTGTSNDGDSVKAEFSQELTSGDVLTRKELLEFYIKGKLSPEQEVTISFTRYDKLGELKDTKTETWNLSDVEANAFGIGQAPIGLGDIGSTIGSYNTIESFLHKRIRVHDYQRLVVTVTEESELPLELNYFALVTRNKGRNRIYSPTTRQAIT